MAKKPQQATAAQASDVQAAVQAIDWGKVDWTKVAVFLQMILQFLPRQPMQAGADLAGCSHEDCCLQALQSALCSAQCAAHCYQTCHDHPEPESEPA